MTLTMRLPWKMGIGNAKRVVAVMMGIVSVLYLVGWGGGWWQSSTLGGEPSTSSLRIIASEPAEPSPKSLETQKTSEPEGKIEKPEENKSSSPSLLSNPFQQAPVEPRTIWPVLFITKKSELPENQAKQHQGEVPDASRSPALEDASTKLHVREVPEESGRVPHKSPPAGFAEVSHEPQVHVVVGEVPTQPAPKISPDVQRTSSAILSKSTVTPANPGNSQEGVLKAEGLALATDVPQTTSESVKTPDVSPTQRTRPASEALKSEGEALSKPVSEKGRSESLVAMGQQPTEPKSTTSGRSIFAEKPSDPAQLSLAGERAVGGGASSTSGRKVEERSTSPSPISPIGTQPVLLPNRPMMVALPKPTSVPETRTVPSSAIVMPSEPKRAEAIAPGPIGSTPSTMAGLVLPEPRGTAPSTSSGLILGLTAEGPSLRSGASNSVAPPSRIALLESGSAKAPVPSVPDVPKSPPEPKVSAPPAVPGGSILPVPPSAPTPSASTPAPAAPRDSAVVDEEKKPAGESAAPGAGTPPVDTRPQSTQWHRPTAEITQLGPFEVRGHVDEMKVIVRRSKILRTKVDIYRVSVVDPGVCDVVQYTPRELSIIGKSQGATDVTFWFADERYEPITYLVRVVPDPELQQRREEQYGILEDVLAELFPESKIKLIPVADKLLVKGQARDAEEAAQIMAVIRGQMVYPRYGEGYGLVQGTAAPPLPQEQGTGALPATQVINMLYIPGVHQVALRVKIAELNRSAARNFGVDMDLNFVWDDGMIAIRQLLNLATSTAVVSGTFDNERLNFGIHYLQEHGVMRILSEPTLVTLSGRPATFVAGGEFAVPTTVGVAGAAAVTTDFRAFGAIITFLPVVLDKDLVRLEVAPEFSRLNSEYTVNGTPGLDTRAVTTTVELREGQTLAIAGLLEDSMNGNNTSNVPLLGQVFGRRNMTRNETELIILVTPELIHPMEPEEVPPLPGFDVTEPTNLEFYLKGRLEGRPTHEYRSTVWPRLRHRYQAGGPATISGPFGHSK